MALSDGNGFEITGANNTVTRSIASGTRGFGFMVSRGSVRSGPTGIVLSRDVSIGNQQGFNILGSATLTKVAAVRNLGGGAFRGRRRMLPSPTATSSATL